MIVVLDSKDLYKKSPEGYFLQNLYLKLAHENPEIQFLFLTNKEIATTHLLRNIAIKVLKNSPLYSLETWWQKRAVKSFLRKNKVDYYVEFNQITDFKDKSFKHFALYTGNTAIKSITACDGIVFIGQSILEDSLKKGIEIPIPHTSINYAIYSGLYKQEGSHSSVISKYTDGKQFFLCSDAGLSNEGFITLLKAFSSFKKLQQTNWKLLIINRSNSLRNLEVLQTFKFKNDVIILNEPSPASWLEITKNAYAAISLDNTSFINIATLEAVLSGIPLIAAASPANLPFDKSLLLLHNNSEQVLAEKMMILYKNEGLREQLSNKMIRLKTEHFGSNPIRELSNWLFYNPL